MSKRGVEAAVWLGSASRKAGRSELAKFVELDVQGMSRRTNFDTGVQERRDMVDCAPAHPGGAARTRRTGAGADLGATSRGWTGALPAATVQATRHAPNANWLRQERRLARH